MRDMHTGTEGAAPPKVHVSHFSAVLRPDLRPFLMRPEITIENGGISDSEQNPVSYHRSRNPPLLRKVFTNVTLAHLA